MKADWKTAKTYSDILYEKWNGIAKVTINRLFPEPGATLLNGILLGYDHVLPEDLAEDFQATGTSHIIAISGFRTMIWRYGKTSSAIGRTQLICFYHAIHKHCPFPTCSFILFKVH